MELFLSLNENTQNLLKYYINEDHPLGPANAADIKDETVSKYLFNTENKIYKSFMKNPTIIIGRRGAGKTAYLINTPIIERYDIILPIPTANLFIQVLEKIQELAKFVILPENTADIWDIIFKLLFLKNSFRT